MSDIDKNFLTTAMLVAGRRRFAEKDASLTKLIQVVYSSKKELRHADILSHTIPKI